MIESIDGLIAFLKHYHRDWMADPSLDPALIPGDLPPGLTRLYRELGGLVQLNSSKRDFPPFSTEDGLLAPDKLERRDGLICFAHENQWVWSASFPAGQPNPPVYCESIELWGEDNAGRVTLSDSLDEFLISLSLHEAVFSSRRGRISNAPTLEALKVPLLPLWLGRQYVPIGEETYNFYASPDREVIVLKNNDVVWIGSTSHELRDLVVPGVQVFDSRRWRDMTL